MLYELLSGRRPFNFRSRLPDEIARVLLTEEPERPKHRRNAKARSRGNWNCIESSKR